MPAVLDGDLRLPARLAHPGRADGLEALRGRDRGGHPGDAVLREERFEEGSEVGGVRVVAGDAGEMDADALLELSDRVKQKGAPAAVVLGAREDGRVHLVANFSDLAVERGANASDVVKAAAALVGGGGGGRPSMARAGGRDPERLPEALAEARRACERAQRLSRKPPGAALYLQGDIHRLSGEFAEAEAAYRAASELGFEPQPGLALLRLAQGRTDAACAALRRLTSGTRDRIQRAGVLPAHVEIMLASGDLGAARRARDELQELADAFATDVLRVPAPVPATR